MMNFFKKLDNLDSRIIYIFLALVIIVPLMSPLKLPLTVSDETKTFHGVIDKLKEGSKILISLDYEAGSVDELDPQVMAILRHALAKNLKIVGMSTVPEGSMFVASTLDRTYKAAGKKYGEDYVNLGFLAGSEAGLTAFAKDPAGTLKSDFAGASTTSLPIMGGIKSVKDFALTITVNNGPNIGCGPIVWVRQVATPYQEPTILAVAAVMAPASMPYVQAKQLQGMISGIKGAAEYELMIEKPGMGVSIMDAQSMAHLAIVAFIVLGNIGLWVMKRNPASK